MTMRSPIKSLLFLSVSAAMAGCTIDIADPSNTRPVIHLNGDKTVELALNEAFVEPGFQALDAEDGDITSDVLISNAAVNSSVAGEYEITYRVSDSGDLDATPAKRLIIVAAATNSNTDAGELPNVDDNASGTDTTDDQSEDAGKDSHDSEYSHEDDALSVPLISSFRLLGYTPEKQKVEVSEIKDGATLDLSLVPTDLINIEAVSVDSGNTGSVHFVLEGPITLDRYENNAIYTLAVEPAQFNLTNDELPVGDYSLTVTPYSAPDMGGAVGSSKTVAFKVRDKEIVTSPVSSTLAADVVVVNEGTGDFDKFSRITEGYNLDLSQVPAPLINIMAVNESNARTGSVHFSLDGPTIVDRYENWAAFTLAPEQAPIDITKDGLRNGDYTLIITPYAESNMGGEAGIPLMLNFSVSGSGGVTPGAPTPTPGPVITPPAETVTLSLNADSYTFDKGSDLQPGMTTAVSANDEFDALTATFKVVSRPKHGTVKMFDLGFFEYTPAAGFSGTDSFTYEVSQNGKTAKETASITVFDPQTNQGFTAIEPSPDSKLIYVSSSQGNDSNTCLAPASPCKSIGAALEKMRSGYPDHVYLKRGDVWRGQTISNIQSGRSTAEPAVLAFYGDSGARPRLESDSTLFAVSKNSQAKKNLNIIGLHFAAYKLDPENAAFTGSAEHKANIKLLAGNENILFEDNLFDYLEIVLQPWDNGSPKNFTFRRNIWTGAYVNTSSYNQKSRPSNMYASGVDGLVIEENVIDHGGWNAEVEGAGANMYNHNLYLQWDNVGNTVVVRNNIITRGSSHGVQIRAGGLVENNFFGKNAVSVSIGYFNRPLQAGTFARVHNNTITEGHSMYKGIDACEGTNLCTAAVYGMSGNDYGDGEISARENIVHSLASEDTKWKAKHSKLALSAYKLGEATQVDNISWKWDDAGTKTDGKAYPAPDRTLADYHAYIGGEKTFEAFMDVVLERPLQTWDEKYSADSVNDYIRAGYGR